MHNLWISWSNHLVFISLFSESFIISRPIWIFNDSQSIDWVARFPAHLQVYFEWSSIVSAQSKLYVGWREGRGVADFVWICELAVRRQEIEGDIRGWGKGKSRGREGNLEVHNEAERGWQADTVSVVFIVAVLGELTVTVERHRHTSNHGRRGWFIFVS